MGANFLFAGGHAEYSSEYPYINHNNDPWVVPGPWYALDDPRHLPWSSFARTDFVRPAGMGFNNRFWP